MQTLPVYPQIQHTDTTKKRLSLGHLDDGFCPLTCVYRPAPAQSVENLSAAQHL